MKKKINKIKENIIKYVITNRLFLSYVILSLLSAILVRKFTVGGTGSFAPFITDLGEILLFGSLGYLVKPKNQFKYYFIWLFIFTAMSMVNSIYYTFYDSFASFGELATAGQVESVSNSLLEKLRFADFIYLINPVIFYLIHKKLKATNYYHNVRKLFKNKMIVLITLIVSAICLSFSFITATRKDYSRLAKQWNRVYIVERFGIITYQFNDLIQTLTPRINSLFGHEEAIAKFQTYFDKREKHHNNKYTGILKGKNIIFVHMESIQTFLMDLKFNGVEVAPNLNKMAKEGMFFNNFYPQVSIGTSSDTEFSLNTGLLPAASGTVYVSYYNRNYFALPKYFKELGYYTFSMHGNYATMWNRNKAHPSLGYEGMYYRECFNFTPEDVINLGINDQLFFEQGIKIMEDIEQNHPNYMGTVITLSNHSPFNQASKLSNLDLSLTYEEKDDITGEMKQHKSDYLSESNIGKYIKSANYADWALGKLVEYVNNSPYFNDTVFVFYGDHDAKFSNKEINYLYNLNPKTGSVYNEKDSHYYNYDYYAHELNKKTPLIIWTKNKKLRSIFKGKISYNMGMYDIAPTILNMYGLTNKYVIGHDIFNIKNKNVIVFPNGNVLTNKIYYNNSTGEYKVLKKNAVITEDYINQLVKTADEELEVSNAIIVYDLLKDKKINEE